MLENSRCGRAAWMVIGMLAAGLWGVSAARADNGTITLDGVSSNAPVDSWYVGYNTTGAGLAGKNNTLLIKNGGSLTNSPIATGKLFGLGEAGGNDNNSATVQDANSRWYVTNGVLQVGRSGSNNRLTVTNGGEVVAMLANPEANVFNPLVVGRDGTNNLLVVSGAGSKVLTPNGGMSVGYWINSISNRLIVTDGGLVSNAVGAGVGAGHHGSSASCYNRVTVGGGANTSRWVVVTDPLRIGCYANCVGNSVTVTNKGVIEVLQNASGIGLFVAGGTAAGQRDNELVVRDGGQVRVARVLTVGCHPSSYVEEATVAGNRLTVTGQGSFVDVGVQFQLGYQSRGMSNVVTVADGGRMDVKGLFRFGRFSLVWLDPAGNALIVSNGVLNVTTNVDSGDIVFTGRGNRIEVLAGGSVTNRKMELSGHLNAVTVSGANSRLVFTEPYQSPYYNFQMSSGNSNTFVVANGGTVVGYGGSIVIGGVGPNDSGPAGTGNVLRVTGPGSQVISAASFYAGRGPDAKDNRIEVLDGGLIEIGDGGGLKIRQNSETGGTSAGGNVITNSGGIYQFGSATPLVYTNDGAIYISDGTISFRAITNANVKGNWSGSDIRKFRWSGNNAFRLNNATNAATGQDYVFGAGLGATNYVRLDLMNGSLYRGGAVTVAAGGSLVVSNGVSAIASNLTLQTGGTLAVDLGASPGVCSRLTAQSGVSLGGAVLKVSASHEPVRDYAYVILEKTSSGQIPDAFATRKVNVEFGGKTFSMAVTTTGGDNNDVALRVAESGTVLLIR